MDTWNDHYAKKGVLEKTLRDLRDAGQFRHRVTNGKTRAEITRPLLNAILGVEREWGVDQCERFFEELLNEYCPSDHLAHMRAVSGIEEGYRKKDTDKVAIRRQKFFRQKQGTGLFRADAVKSLGDTERNILGNIAEWMRNNHSGELKSFVCGLFPDACEGILTSGPELQPDPQPESEPEPRPKPEPEPEPEPRPEPEPEPGPSPEPDGDNTKINTGAPEEVTPATDLTKVNKRLRVALITTSTLIALILVAVIGSIVYLNNYTINFTVNLKERLYGLTAWNDELNVELGDVIEYKLEFVNDSSPLSSALLNLCDKLGISVTSRKVKVQFTLPDNLEYVEGSTALYDSDVPDGVATIMNDLINSPDRPSTVIDTITTSGIDINPSFINANGSICIRCKIVKGDLVIGFDEDRNVDVISGIERVVTRATATVDDTVEEDSATLFLRY